MGIIRRRKASNPEPSSKRALENLPQAGLLSLNEAALFPKLRGPIRSCTLWGIRTPKFPGLSRSRLPFRQQGIIKRWSIRIWTLPLPAGRLNLLSQSQACYHYTMDHSSRNSRTRTHPYRYQEDRTPMFYPIEPAYVVKQAILLYGCLRDSNPVLLIHSEAFCPLN